MLVVGNYVSPYVRKVLAALAIKGVAYEIDPITPFYGNDAFSRLSPLRRVPVLIDRDLAIPESAVIGEYLNDCLPDPPLLPTNPADRARARAIQSWADGALGDVIVWKIFYPFAVKPAVFGAPRDKEALRHAVAEDLPPLLDHIETLAPADGYLFGDIGLADLSVAVFFRNAAVVRAAIDPERWPKAAAWVDRVLDHPALLALRPFEDICLRTPIAQHREALIAAGAPVSQHSFGSEAPRESLTRR